jgi:hypothetical protein
MSKNEAKGAAARLPLFYRAPQPLSPVAHGAWRLKGGDVSFARDACFVPIVVGEFAQASRFYPILFSADDATPVALLGLERTNLFLTDGCWAEDVYIPAYVRRYPFGFMATQAADRFVLAIDAGSEHVVRTGVEGIPLFADGAPSELTKRALQFCEAFQGEARATRDFAIALNELGLLTERRADAALPSGRKLAVQGFQVIDSERFSKLDDQRVVEWHRNGWLALAYAHVASLGRFSDLLARQQQREPCNAAVPPMPSPEIEQ